MATIASMRVKTTTAADGTAQTRTYSPLTFSTAGTSFADQVSAVKYMAQRLVSLTSNTYGTTDLIKTTNVDTEEVTSVG